MQKFNSILVIIILSFIIIDSQPIEAGSLNEADTISFLTQNPETVIIDIRWQQIYEDYHLRGAILVSNSDPQRNHQQASTASLSVANEQTNYNYTHPIFVVCNCPASLEKDQGGDGTYASEAAEYLQSNNYSNVHHFYGSFSNWINIGWLVSGANPDGPPLTAPIPQQGSGGLELFVIVGGLVFIAGSIGVIVYALRGSTSTVKIQEQIKSSENKKKGEIKKMKDLLDGEKTSVSESKSKQKRRKRR